LTAVEQLIIISNSNRQTEADRTGQKKFF